MFRGKSRYFVGKLRNAHPLKKQKNNVSDDIVISYDVDAQMKNGFLA